MPRNGYSIKAIDQKALRYRKDSEKPPLTNTDEFSLVGVYTRHQIAIEPN